VLRLRASSCGERSAGDAAERIAIHARRFTAVTTSRREIAIGTAILSLASLAQDDQ
jgi:hypothetical protein